MRRVTAALIACSAALVAAPPARAATLDVTARPGETNAITISGTAGALTVVDNGAVDAIYSSARYLRSSGAPRNYRRALFAYNHANWYVNMVLRAARRY